MSNIRYYTDGEQATADTLNRPIKDLESLMESDSETNFNRTSESIRNSFASSGFLTGKHTSQEDGGRHYMFSNNIPISVRYAYGGYPNKFGLNVGEHQGNETKAHVNGVIHNLSGLQNYVIETPEAPTLDGIENNISNFSKVYKPGDWIYFTDTSTNLIPVLAEYVEQNGSLTNNGDGSYIYSNTNGQSYHAWYFIKNTLPGMGSRFILGAKYTLTFDIGNYTGNFNIGGYSISNKVVTQVGSNVTIKFICSSESNLSMYINSTTVGESITLSNFSMTMDKSILLVYGNKKETTETNFMNGSFGLFWKIREEIFREDLVFLESWHELISDTDAVYSNGFVQQAGQGYRFAGDESYSLFGSWQIPETTIGKAVQWSTLTSDEKNTWISNKDNNIYLTKSGAVQVRYRIRVEKGLGGGFKNYKNETGNYYIINSDNTIPVQGSRKTIADKYNNDSEYVLHNGREGKFPAQRYANNFRSEFTYIAQNGQTGNYGTDYAYKGIYGAIPLFIISRNNKGSYEPTFNPTGTALFGDSLPWYETSESANSILDCFSNIVGGTTESQLSGRPDNNSFDMLYDTDFEDLRIDCNKYSNEEILTKALKEAIMGVKRGKEKFRNECYKANHFGSSSSDKGRLYIEKSPDSVGKQIRVTVLDAGLSDMNYLEEFTTVVNNYDEDSCYVHLPSGRNGNLTSGTAGMKFFITGLDYNYTFQNQKTVSPAYNNDILLCDIFGDTLNYPNSWIENGTFGSTKLCGEDGADFSLTSPNVNNVTGAADALKFNISRKFSSIKLVLVKKADGGFQKYNYEGGGGDHIKFGYSSQTAQSFNGISINADLSWESLGFTDKNDMLNNTIIQVFYIGYAKPYYFDTDRYVYSDISDVHAGNWYNMDYNGQIVESALDKVPVRNTNSNEYYNVVPFKRNVQIRNTINTGDSMNNRKFEHESIKLTPGGPSIKYCAWLEEYNEKAVLKILFNELKDKAITFIDKVPTDVVTSNKGDVIRLNYSSGNSILLQSNGTTDSTTTYETYAVYDGKVIIKSTGSLSNVFVTWNGEDYADKGFMYFPSGSRSLSKYIDGNGNNNKMGKMACLLNKRINKVQKGQ